jgi:hypothetical protein
VEAVDVLRRIEPADCGLLVEVVRQRGLDEDAVDAVIRVQLRDEPLQLLLRGLCRQPVVDRPDADLLRRVVLAAHVDVRSRVVSDEDRREADVAEPAHFPADLSAKPLRQSLSVHESCCHGGEVNLRPWSFAAGRGRTTRPRSRRGRRRWTAASTPRSSART